MKIKKIGDLNYKKYSTEVCATDSVLSLLDKNKISHSTLIPAGWFFYDSELFDSLDENGDGKPDENFGFKFKIIYFLDSESIRELEKHCLFFSQLNIKGIEIKYGVIKNE